MQLTTWRSRKLVAILAFVGLVLPPVHLSALRDVKTSASGHTDYVSKAATAQNEAVESVAAQEAAEALRAELAKAQSAAGQLREGLAAARRGGCSEAGKPQRTR